MMNQKGVSITAVVFIIVILSFMGVIFVSLLTTGTEESVVEYDSSRALYIAEGGAEAAIGHLKQPASYCGGNCWLWNDGYFNNILGNGTIDVEVLQYKNKDGAFASPRNENFNSCTEAAGANPARTIYITLSWDPAVNPNNLGVELYEGATLLASSVTSNNPEIIRYRITGGTACPVDTAYTARVLGNTVGSQYYLRISHPDESGFTSISWRSIISTGRMNNARREVFTAFRK